MTYWLGILAASAALIAYAYAGYPLAMLAWARWAPRRVATAPFTPRVAVVIVVRNGAAMIGPKIADCLAQDYPAERIRIVVASDGSTDGTVAAVEALGDPRVTVCAFPQWRGKAACLNDALATCDEDFVVLTDARQRLDRGAVRLLLENLADPAVGAVSGQLVFERDGITGFGEAIDAYWRYEKRLRQCESRVHSCVGVTGALYALRRASFRPIPPGTILDDVLVPMQVVMGGLRVVFEERAIAYDRPSTDAAIERSRKVRTLAGNFQLLARHPQLMLPWADPIAPQFLSHKVARLLVPPAMVSALGASVALADQGAPFAIVLGLQLAGYAMAAAGALSPAAARLRPVRLAMTFMALNWFVVLGFVQFVTQRDGHLWGSPPAPGGARSGG